jgi:transcription antitermination factor NusG
MKKKWLICLYKINEIKRVERNLFNQNFNFYLPKITKKKINSNPKEEILFPGYIFVNTNFENYLALKSTLGMKNIIKFGNNISCISDSEIEAMQIVEKASKINPIVSKIKIGQDVMISKGSFKGIIAKVCSLPSKERIDIFLTFLGSRRKITIPKKDIIF